jgi:hypothetical protein
VRCVTLTVGQRDASMNAVVMMVAKQAAIKAVKGNMQAQGVKVVYVARRIIVAAANAYLTEHPELIEQAAETVRKVPQFRTLAEREERQRKGNRR